MKPTYQHQIQKTAFQLAKRNQIQDLVDLCHGASKEAGWWNGVDLPTIPRPDICTKLLLVVTEIAEATEGVRKDCMDDKLPHRKMVEVELADAAIRIFDLAGAMGLDLGAALVEKMVYNVNREDHKKEIRETAGGKSF